MIKRSTTPRNVGQVVVVLLLALLSACTSPRQAARPELSTNQPLTAPAVSLPPRELRDIYVSRVPGAQFTSIQRAIDAAPTGATVYVAPGRYDEAIRMKTGITIIGAGPEKSLIETSTVDGAHPAVVTCQGVHNATLRGFSVTFTGTKPGVRVVNITESSAVTIAANHLAGATEFGIVAGLVSGVSVIDNSLRQNRLTGLLVLGPGTTDVRIENNQIVDNGVGADAPLGDRFGVVVAAASVALRGNLIRGNTGHGVFVTKGARVVLEGNTVTDNGRGADERFGAGVFVTENSTSHLRENRIVENATDGIIVSGGSTATIEHNTIARNGHLKIEGRGHGIKIVDASPVIRNNTIIDNRGAGIWGNTVTAALESNQIAGNLGGNLDGINSDRRAVETIARNLGFPYHMAVEGDHLYWLETDVRFPGKDGVFPRGWVKRFNKKERSVTIVFSTEDVSPASPPVDVHVVRSDLYWMEVLPARIWRLSPQSESRQLATGGRPSITMAVDERYVYWADYGQNATLHRVDKAGTSTVEIGTGLSNVGQIVAREGSVYWIEMVAERAGTLKRVSRDGGSITLLANGLTAPKRLAADRSGVYWTESGAHASGGSIWRVGHTGGTPHRLVAELNDPWSIALDDEAVYWVEREGGTVRKIGKNGVGLTTLASRLQRPWGLAVDEHTVYWSEELGACVRRTNKK